MIIKVHISIIIIILLSIKVSYSQNISEKYLTSGIGYDIIDGFDNSYYCSGSTGSTLLVVKTNYSGDTIWTKEFGNSTCMTPADVNGVHLKKIAENKILICGNRYVCGTFSKAYFVAIDTSGNLLWENQYGITETYISSFIQKDNYIYAVGNTFNGSSTDGVILKLDSSGGLIWNNNIDFGLTEEFFDVNIYNNDELIIAGESNSFASTNYSDGIICILDTSGNLVSHTSFGGNQYESLNCISRISDGYIFSGSTSTYSFGGKDAYIIKTDNQLNLIWDKNIGDQLENVSTRTIVSDGFIFGTGWTYISSMLSNAWMFELDTLGNLISENNFGDSLYDFSFSFIKRDNNLVLVGSSEFASSNMVNMILIDSFLTNQDNIHNNVISDIKLYPNPNETGTIFILGSGFETQVQKSEFQIIDWSGKNVLKGYSENQSNEPLSIDIQDLKSGLYFVLLSNGSKNFNFKLIKL